MEINGLKHTKTQIIMLTITFTIIAILNALMLLALLGVIYYKNTSDNEGLI